MPSYVMVGCVQVAVAQYYGDQIMNWTSPFVSSYAN